MKLKNSNTVLLVFARSLPDEVRHKPLLHKNGFSRYIYQQLNSHLKKTLIKTDLPVIWWDSTYQKHASFGENFKQAFEFAFTQQYENVIAIGNDCPTLNFRDILHTFNLLQEKKMVLGPAHDGGIYLMGLNKNCFCDDLFDTIRWQTSHVLHDLCKQTNLDFHFLATKSDLDTFEDLQLLSRQKMQYEIAMNIYLFLQSWLDLQYSHLLNYFLVCNHQNILLRAPPVCY